MSMIWLSLFFLFIILEVVTGTGWFFVIGLSALFSSIIAFPLQISPGGSVCSFASISILISILKFYYDKKYRKSTPPEVNEGATRFIGKIFTLHSDIVNGKGQLLIGDTFWPVETLQGEDYSAGTKIIVTDIQGIILKVIKTDTDDIYSRGKLNEKSK